MTFEQLIAVLRARWIIALGTLLVIFGTVAAFTWLMPKTYTAVASVLVDVKSADPIAGGVPQAVMAPSYLMTQIDVLTSARVAQKVVSNLRLTEVPSLREKWVESTGSTGSFEGYVAQMIRSGLEARPSRGSNVINLQYQAADPAFASAIVNAFVAAYLETSMELRTDPAKQYSTFFDGNAKQLREKLETAQAKLSAFQQRQGLVVNDERLDVESGRLSDLSQAYVSMQTAVADSGSRSTVVKAQGGNTQDVMGSPLVASLKQDVVRIESQLGQMLTKYGDNHPQTVEVRTSLEQLRAKLNAEMARVGTSVTLNNSINVSRAAQVKASLEEQRAKVLKMKQMRNEAELLQSDVDNARRAYEGVMARLSMTSLESQAVLNNVVALEYAVTPSIPSSPRVFTNLALGLLVGAIVAMAIALVVERSDRRLRTVGEIEGVLHLPHIGTVPSFKKALKGSTSLSERLQLGNFKLKALAR